MLTEQEVQRLDELRDIRDSLEAKGFDLNKGKAMEMLQLEVKELQTEVFGQFE